jgi:hypothetical protein
MSLGAAAVPIQATRTIARETLQQNNRQGSRARRRCVAQGERHPRRLSGDRSDCSVQSSLQALDGSMTLRTGSLRSLNSSRISPRSIRPLELLPRGAAVRAADLGLSTALVRSIGDDYRIACPALSLISALLRSRLRRCARRLESTP